MTHEKRRLIKLKVDMAQMLAMLKARNVNNCNDKMIKNYEKSIQEITEEVETPDLFKRVEEYKKKQDRSS